MITPPPLPHSGLGITSLIISLLSWPEVLFLAALLARMRLNPMPPTAPRDILSDIYSWLTENVLFRDFKEGLAELAKVALIFPGLTLLLALILGITGWMQPDRDSTFAIWGVLAAVAGLILIIVLAFYLNQYPGASHMITPPPLPPFPHSGLGIASLVINVVAWALVLIPLVIWMLIAPDTPQIVPGEVPRGVLDWALARLFVWLFGGLFVGIALVVLAFGTLLALVLGIVGLFQQGRRKLCAVLGTLFSAVGIAIVLAAIFL